MATGLEKVSFHSNPKERQCQRMLKLPHNCTHLTLRVTYTRNLPIFQLVSNLPIFQLLDGLQLFPAQYTLTGITVHVSLSICEEHHLSPHPGVNLGAQQICLQFSLSTARLHSSWLYRVRTAPSILYEIISSHPCQP